MSWEEYRQGYPWIENDDWRITADDIRKCSGKRLALDTETTGLSWIKNGIIGIGIWCPDARIAGYMPCRQLEDAKACRQAILDLDPSTVVIMHNMKFDCHMMGIPPGHWDFALDTTDLVHLIDSRFKKSAESVERQFLGTETKKYYVDKHGRTKIWDWSEADTAEYCINDVRIEYTFAQVLAPMVQDLGLWDVFVKDMEYMKLLWEVERRGIELDTDFIARAIIVQRDALTKMEQMLYDSIGYHFNWRSTKQLSKAIYDDMGIKKPKNPFAGADGVDRSRFADAGKYKSTCTSTFLLTEKVHHPLGELISSMRESDRLRKVMEGWLDLMDRNQAVHTNFNITGTRTGRLSSSKPNIQNVPSEVRGKFTQSVYSGSTIRTAEYNLRKAFVARPGHALLSIDYKQMEMRMFGILSGDPFMLKSLAAGRDIHGDIAERVWGTRDEVHREWSKTISFGLIYGMTIGSLMYKLNMTKPEAARVCDQYWAEFPRIKPWLDDVVLECKTNGFIRYWDGRIWRENVEIDMYKGANAQIQGGCAELLSVAGLRVNNWVVGNYYSNGNGLMDHWKGPGIWNLVHDEIITEVPIPDILFAARNIATIMQVPDLFGIPFMTDAKVGRSYGDMIKIDKAILNDPNYTTFDLPEIVEEPAVEEKDEMEYEILMDDEGEESTELETA